MLHFSKNEFDQWERIYRANFISTLSGYKPAMLVGTYNKEGIANLSLFQNLVHLGANPALIGMVSRPREASPHTLGNLEASGWFSLNCVQASFIEKAHQTSAKYDAQVSEFEAVGLELAKREDIPVPFVASSAIQLALKVEQIIPVTLNNTFFIIGSVQHVFLQAGLLADDGTVQLNKAEVVCTAGLDGYYLPRLLHRFAYAKPGKPVNVIQ
jgi:flavin reductase (DIM6/NTAB) family NADH-FMN oxidoreductase RutF